MSALFNQTNISPGQSLYLTRTEVIQGFSTLAGDLSGVNLSTIFVNPNPVVSTLTVNPSGTISLPGSINTTALSVSSIGVFRGVRGFGTNYNAVGLINSNATNYNALYTAGVVAQNSVPDTNGDKMVYGTNFMYGIPQASGVPNPFISWLSGNSSNTQYALQNVSSINGIVPGQGMTTFTSLTGSNLTTTGTLTSPQIVSLSSINGVPYSAVYNGTITPASQNYPITLTSNVAGVVASINLPAGYLQPNQTYIYDVPFSFLSYPTGGGFPVNIGIRLGNNGQINYQVPLMMVAGSQGLAVNLTGIAQTNTTVVGSQQIQIIAVQVGAPSFTCTFQSPPSAGGANVFSIKPLS